MALSLNPYVAGNPVGDSCAFIGRADVLREVVRVLRRPQGNGIVLFGQRRIGKTSILQHLAARLPDEGPYKAVYFDLQDKADWPLARVLLELARTVAHALGQPDPDLGDDPETAFRDEWLPAILDDLPEGCSLALLFDEFDVLADPKKEQAAAAFFPYLRGLLASDPERLQFVFVIGRNVDDLDTIALSLFKGTPYQRVSLLSREDTADLVRLAEQNGTLTWPDETVERVWQLTNGHPFLTQQLCSHVWERAYDEEPDEPPTASPEDVDEAVPDALDASRNTLEWLWNGLPPAERVVASALAEAGPGPITQDELEQLLHESGVRVVIRELQNAPRLLQDWDLIEPADGGYNFRVELLRRWLVEHKPLRSVQEELDRIEPVAENFYRAGLGLYRSGQLDQAIGPLRQAIGLNPNHIGANQLLADILLAQGEVDEARQLLERLYEYHPAAARSSLVQALLTLAQTEESDDEQLALYERVLELSPAQPEARSGKRRIWRQRGDAALEDDNLETSLAAYQEADLADKVAEVEQEMRRRDLAAGLQKLESLQQERRYQNALALAGELAARYSQEREWKADLERLERKTHLADLYRRALEAWHSGDRQAAQALLIQVISLEPGYEEATRYLHLAVTGEDVDEIQGQLEAKEEATQKAKTIAKKKPKARRQREREKVLLAVYQQILGERNKRMIVGNFLTSTLIWMPLLIPTLALGTGTMPYAEQVPLSTACLLISLGLILAWLLVAWTGNNDGNFATTVAIVTSGIAAFAVMGFVIFIMMSAPVYTIASSREINAASITMGCMLIVVAFVIAGIAVRCVAHASASRMATSMATAVAFIEVFIGAFVVMFIVVFAIVFFVMFVVVDLVIAGGWAPLIADTTSIAGIVGICVSLNRTSNFRVVLATIIAFSVASLVAFNLATEKASAVMTNVGTAGAFMLSLLSHAFLIWFSFLGGWRVFQ